MQQQQKRIPLYYQPILFPGKKYQCTQCKKDTSSFTFIGVGNGYCLNLNGGGQGNGSGNSGSSNGKSGEIGDWKIYCIPCFARLKKFPTQYRVMNKLQFPVFRAVLPPTTPKQKSTSKTKQKQVQSSNKNTSKNTNLNPNKNTISPSPSTLSLSLSLTSQPCSWTALEQIYLFEGLEKHGFGNWNQISQYIQSNKSKQDVEQHYTEMYLNGNRNFVPNDSQVLTRKQLKQIQSQSPSKSKPKPQKNRQTLTSKRIQSLNLQKSLSKLSKSQRKQKSKLNPLSSLSPVSSSIYNPSNSQNPNQSSSPNSNPHSNQSRQIGSIQIVGYMPLRNDYEYQYDNEAELLLAEMEFLEEDTAEEIEMKFQIIELYNRRLREREMKKQFVRSRGILDLQRQQAWEKGVSKSEKEIYNMMKIFSRFSTAGQHQQLVRGIIRQKQLRQKIEQYKQLRRRGFRTKSQIQDEIQRKNDCKTKKKSSTESSHMPQFDPSRIRRNPLSPNSHLSKPSLSSTQTFPHSHSSKLTPASIYLSTEQIEMLKSLKISALSYMMIKQTILREFCKYGRIVIGDKDRDRDNKEKEKEKQNYMGNGNGVGNASGIAGICGMFNLDRNMLEKICGFLEDAGYIVCQ